ncbi:MAG: hypothetical protein JO001_04455 [Alphaproteobacteria bacterium]|nr:hypothetical protein [Alphaproteobacteria bacterium]
MSAGAIATDEGLAATRHGYPVSAMVGDYLRSAAGLVPVAIILAVVPVATVPAVILGGFGAVFAVFGARTVVRHQTRLELTETGIRITGLVPRAISWAELERMRLAYYSTRRDKRDGWMQLELSGAGARISIDSRLDGFDEVVRRATFAAATRNLNLADATAANLEALGIRVPGQGERLGELA